MDDLAEVNAEVNAKVNAEVSCVADVAADDSLLMVAFWNSFMSVLWALALDLASSRLSTLVSCARIGAREIMSASNRYPLSFLFNKCMTR